MAELTVMTWNVQNLFPAGGEFGPATQQDYDDKIAALAAVIDAVEPDLLAAGGRTRAGAPRSQRGLQH
jgi:hypothetical protein